MISVWEMQIKLSIGKLKPRKALATIIAEQQQDNDLHLLPVTLEHVLTLEKLPLHHRDPFDRLLIAQAVAEQMAVITSDPQMARYPVQVIW